MTNKWLHPSLTNRGKELQEQWKRAPNLRLQPFIKGEKLQDILTEMRKRPFHLQATEPGQFRFQYWAFNQSFFQDDNSVLGDFCRWFRGDFSDWISSWTGRSVGIRTQDQILSTLFTKGCYLDPHNDFDGKRSIAYVIGLSTDSWPRKDGGHLEFLAPTTNGYEVKESRPPGWNCIDLFDVTQTVYLHQVSLVTEKHERRAFAGWLYPQIP